MSGNRPLLPAPSKQSPIDTAIVSKRSNAAIACERCRKKKSKCDGSRPKCGGCKDGKATCVYCLAEGDTHRQALKRKHGQLEDENKQYSELYSLIRNRSTDEAQEIFNRIRTSDHPIEVLRFVKQADILLPNPSSSDACETDPRIRKLNHEALAAAPIKVYARPWTTVAGDGIVSELVSEFFASQHLYFFCAVDREAFQEDMRLGDLQNAKFCSPLLVNAICAIRCFWSLRAKTHGFLTSQDMVERFIQESKKLLDIECGRATLCTALALCLMFSTITFQGRDRVGNMYRYMMVEMLKRLNLEKRFSRLRDDDAKEAREKRVISKALWGFFIFESRTCSFYGHPSFIPPPSMPRLFAIDDESNARQQNIDILGNPYSDSSLYPPQTPGLLHAVCDLSKLFHEAVCSNYGDAEVAESKVALASRTALYRKWKQWKDELPDLFRHDQNLTPETCWLNSHAFEVAMNILNLLSPELVLPNEEISVKQLSIQHCQQEVRLGEQFQKHWSSDPLIGRGQFIVLSTLTSFLEDDSIHPLYTRAAYLLRSETKYVPAMNLLMQGAGALALSLGHKIPASARPCFEGLMRNHDVNDLPTSFVVPQIRDMQALLGTNGEEHDESGIGNEISGLIARWSSLTVDS